MEIKQIRDEKRRAELEIKDIICRLMDSTGMNVHDINYVIQEYLDGRIVPAYVELDMRIQK